MSLEDISPHGTNNENLTSNQCELSFNTSSKVRVIFHVKKISLNLKFRCKLSILIKNEFNHLMSQSDDVYLLQNGQCWMNEPIYFQLGVHPSRICHQKFKIVVMLSSANGIVPAGSFQFMLKVDEPSRVIKSIFNLNKCEDQDAEVQAKYLYELIDSTPISISYISEGRQQINKKLLKNVKSTEKMQKFKSNIHNQLDSNSYYKRQYTEYPDLKSSPSNSRFKISKNKIFANKNLIDKKNHIIDIEKKNSLMQNYISKLEQKCRIYQIDAKQYMDIIKQLREDLQQEKYKRLNVEQNIQNINNTNNIISNNFNFKNKIQENINQEFNQCDYRLRRKHSQENKPNNIEVKIQNQKEIQIRNIRRQLEQTKTMLDQKTKALVQKEQYILQLCEKQQKFEQTEEKHEEKKKLLSSRNNNDIQEIIPDENYQLKRKITSLEIQLQHASQNNQNMSKLRIQNSQLQSLNIQLSNDNETFNQQIQFISKTIQAKQIEILGIKQQLQTKRQQIERIIKDKKIEIMEIESTNQQFQSTMKAKQLQIQGLKQQMKVNNKELKKIIQEKEMELMVIKQQFEGKNQQFQIIKNRNIEIQQQIKFIKSQQYCQDIKQQIELKQVYVKQQIKQNQISLEEKILIVRQLQKKIQQIQNSNKLKNIKIEKLEELLQQEKVKILETHIINNQEIDNIKNNNQQLLQNDHSTEMKQMKQIIQNKNILIMNQEKQIKEMKEQIIKMQKLILGQQEKVRKLRQKQDQIQSMQVQIQKYQTIEEQMNEQINRVEEEKIVLMRSIKELQEQNLIEKDRNIQNKVSQIHENKNTNSSINNLIGLNQCQQIEQIIRNNYQKQNDELKNKIQELKQIIQQLKKYQYFYKKQNEKLLISIENNQNQLLDLQIQLDSCHSYEQSAHTLKNQKSELQKEIIVLRQRISQLN